MASVVTPAAVLSSIGTAMIAEAGALPLPSTERATATEETTSSLRKIAASDVAWKARWAMAVMAWLLQAGARRRRRR